jgi:hypothetical protein
MADLTVDAARVALVESPRQPRSLPTGGTVTAGAPVYQDSNGKAVEADAGADATEDPIGIALKSVVANEAVTIAGPDAIVDVGDALADLAYGAPVYLSDTAGELSSTAGSATVRMGTVIPAWSQTTAGKLLRISGSLNG